MFRLKYFALGLCTFYLGCQPQEELEVISVQMFADFVNDTEYITDAEKYGWSIVQVDVFNFETKEGANWRVPNGIDSSKINMPVTQISYHDAMAYCKWANARLPGYDEYWELTIDNEKTINQNSKAIAPYNQVNIVGNTWEITNTENENEEIRLAGGSYFCNPKTCNGVSPNRKLFVDKSTGNIHIGFAVIR